MQDFTKNLDTAPTLPILELVKELTIGQRATNSVELLSKFLHDKIFPKFYPFSTEIYFQNKLSDNFLPPEIQSSYRNDIKSVPGAIHRDHPIIDELKTTGEPVEVQQQQVSIIFGGTTDNKSNLLVPIQDGRTLLALLYLGKRETCSFPPNFLSVIQTFAAVIGSRLKSMDTIRQLKESMHALEYSDLLRTALYEISEQAHYSEDINDLYAKLHQTVGRLIHARNFFIALVDNRHDGKFIKFPYYIDDNDIQFQGMELKMDQKKCSITGYLLKTRQPLLLTPTNFDQICQDNNIQCVGTRPHSWVGAPFFSDHITGAVAIQSYDTIIYTEKDKELISFVARHIGDALNRKRSVDELKKAKERAEKAEKNKSTFLANMSHEIRTPMNGILGLTDLVLHSDFSGPKRSYLEMIHSSAERLLKLINDILDFSKIEAGKLELDIAPFSLRGTISEAIEILAISAAKKNIGLTVDCHEDIPDKLLGDAGKLSQILINLVGNGVKFTDEGKVALSVKQNGHDGNQNGLIDLHFQIRDTGIGIPKKKINNIFKPFSQLTTSQNANQRGTGLGLVIAGELVEMMGGKIHVESIPGVGTTFHFSIEFSPETGSSRLQEKREETSPRFTGTRLSDKPLHILLVEDEYINRTVAITVLEGMGWKVSTAENGIEAMDMLKDSIFDLILMDIQMPQLDGYETTRAIRRQEKDGSRHIPIIAMTAFAFKGDQEKCLKSGMDGYISKPIRLDKLCHEVETVLRSNRTNQDNPQTP
jgi:signal transduction histidine kinase/CheY-like chemotaxis protein